MINRICRTADYMVGSAFAYTKNGLPTSPNLQRYQPIHCSYFKVGKEFPMPNSLHNIEKAIHNGYINMKVDHVITF